MRAIRQVLSSAVILCGVGYAQSVAAATAEEMYARDCKQCHAAGNAGAPRTGDKDEWTRRIRAGKAMLYRNAIRGIPNTAMAPKGGHQDLTDDDVRSMVDYMVRAANLEPQILRAAARYEALGIDDREFIRLDRDYDGYLSRAELAADPVLLTNLGRFDNNRDGQLSPTEFSQAEVTLEAERIAATVDDASLIRDVRAALAKVPGVSLASTRVEVDRGVVSMIGMVSTAEVGRDAYAAIKRIAGIKKIDNRLVSAEQLSFD